MEYGIFLGPKGLAEGRPFSKESGISQSLCLFYSFFRFSRPVWREPELTWTDCAFEFKQSVCCGKATGGKACGGANGANLVLPYAVRTVEFSRG